MMQRTLPAAVSRLEQAMGINDFNVLGREILAGSRSILRERVGNLQAKWHTVDTVAFPACSACFGRHA